MTTAAIDTTAKSVNGTRQARLRQLLPAALRYIARAAVVMAMAGLAVGAATGTAHAETPRCEQAMAHVDWALSNYEGAINSGNRSEINFWQRASRNAIEDMDAACA